MTKALSFRFQADRSIKTTGISERLPKRLPSAMLGITQFTAQGGIRWQTAEKQANR